MAKHVVFEGDTVITMPEFARARHYIVQPDGGIILDYAPGKVFGDKPEPYEASNPNPPTFGPLEPTLAVGSVVRLKSGGPEMIVEGMSRTPDTPYAPYGDLRLSVAWFDAALHLKQLTLGLPEHCYEVLR